MEGLGHSVARRRLLVAQLNVAALAATASTVRVFGPFDRRLRVEAVAWSVLGLNSALGYVVDVAFSRNDSTGVVSGPTYRSVFTRPQGADALGNDGSSGVAFSGLSMSRVVCGEESQAGELFVKVRIYDPGAVGNTIAASVLVELSELEEYRVVVPVAERDGIQREVT